MLAVPGGDEFVPLLAFALERGGEPASLACPVCPSLAWGHGPGAPGLYPHAGLGQSPFEEINFGGGLPGGGRFGMSRAHTHTHALAGRIFVC